jgi:histidinol-phosphate aminotransferase
VTAPDETFLRRRDWLAGAAGVLAALAPGTALAAPNAGATRGAAARVNLSLNESPFGPSPRVVQALANELRGLERYTGDEASDLTREIAELEQVPAEQVLLGEVLEPLGLYLATDNSNGGEFLYSVPGYTALVDATRPVGGVGISIPLNDRLENDLQSFRARLNARTRAVFLVNPHNPSGTVSDAAAFKSAVSELASKVLVIVDEAYLDYTDELAQRSLVERVRAGENVVVFRTFSKLHGLAALPFGYAIAPLQLAKTLRRNGLGSPRSLNRLAVRAAAVSLRDPSHLAQVRAKVSAERARWHQVLDELKLRHSNARASFVFFQSRRSQPELASAMAAEGIDIGRAFPPLLDWTRISIGLPAENQRAQAALRRALA